MRGLKLHLVVALILFEEVHATIAQNAENGEMRPAKHARDSADLD